MPKGILFKTHENVQDYDHSNDEIFNLHYSSDDYLYQMNENKVNCLDCPADENESENVDMDTIENTSVNDTVVTTTVKVNGETVIVKTSKNNSSLKTNEDGVIIKTK